MFDLQSWRLALVFLRTLNSSWIVSFYSMVSVEILPSSSTGDLGMQDFMRVSLRTI
jgi:hypothetical protein